MELKDIASLASLLSTLVMLAYIVGQLRSVFATKADLVSLEKEFGARVAKIENQSITAHNGFATRAELEKTEEKIERKLAQLEAKVDIVNNSIVRLLNLYHRDNPTPKDGHHG